MGERQCRVRCRQPVRKSSACSKTSHSPLVEIEEGFAKPQGRCGCRRQRGRAYRWCGQSRENVRGTRSGAFPHAGEEGALRWGCGLLPSHHAHPTCHWPRRTNFRAWLARLRWGDAHTPVARDRWRPGVPGPWRWLAHRDCARILPLASSAWSSHRPEGPVVGASIKVNDIDIKISIFICRIASFFA